MLRCLAAAVVFCLLTTLAGALPLSPTGASPGEQCRAAITAAERGHAIPSGLLAAIGRVESGRRDPATGDWSPWPWTINAEGQGAWFESKAEVIAAVTALQARGVRSIDVGCMQVNLMYHPTAFPSLDMAFEPAVNADYAARFLTELYGQTGDWTKATADYHSSDPAEGGPYAAKVTEIWPEEQHRAGAAPAMGIASGRAGSSLNPVPPFSAHQPPRLFAMTGASPMMMPPGTSPIGTTSGAEPGQRIAMAGRGLDSYRSVPIRSESPVRRIVGRSSLFPG